MQGAHCFALFVRQWKEKKSDQEKKLLLWVVTRKGPLQDNTNAILNLPSDDTAAMLSKSYKPETKGTNMQPVRISKGL